MMMLAYFTQDRHDEFENATPERLITLFYDQTIDYLHTAISAIARHDIQERCNSVNCAIELLSEMLQCLDLESEDEIVRNLHRIHTFLIVRLPQVNLYNDAKFAAEAIRLLRPIRDAWSFVDKHADEIEAQRSLAIAARSGGRPKLTVVSPIA